MNRIETKIVIMVSQRLSAAKESEEKTDLIEELSENLYQRYLDLAASGLPEKEALSRTMESLGDVEELLAYLEEADGLAGREKRDVSPDETDSTGAGGEKEASGETEWKSEKGAASDPKWKFSFSTEELGNEIEEMVNAAMATARVAVDCARDVARDVTQQFRNRYPDGVFTQFHTEQGQRNDGAAVWDGKIDGLECRLTNGDVHVSVTQDPEGGVEIDGDAEEIESILKENGTLLIRQGRTASSSFLFHRGVRRTDIEIRLPGRLWDRIEISTINGDIRLDPELVCHTLSLQSVNGDCRVEGVTCDQAKVQLSSGDLEIRRMKGALTAESKNGDLSVSGEFGACTLASVSGDIGFAGKALKFDGGSSSGDLALRMEGLPEELKAVSKSGDVSVQVPRDEGFCLTYRTISGDFSTNLALEDRGQKEKNREAAYLGGGSSRIGMFTGSGDLHLFA